MVTLLWKKVFLILGAGLLLGSTLIFREEISQFLSFGNDHMLPTQDIVEEIPRVEESQPTAPKENDDNIQKPREVFKKPPALPIYFGRDPAEIRPVPEEVKLFSDEQKAQLYQTLETHGRTVKADPSFFNGWIQVGILKKTIGDFEGARDAWEYAGIIQSKNSISFSNLGELYWRYLHQYLKSEENFKISIRHKPDDWQNYLSLAELYHYSYKEKAELADDVLLDGLKAIPEDETLMRRLAYLYEQRSEFTKAVEWWEKVLARHSDDQELLGRVNKLKSKF